jgi:hypothetical protein
MLVSMGMFNVAAVVGAAGGAGAPTYVTGPMGIHIPIPPSMLAPPGAGGSATRIPIPVTPPPSSATPGVPPLYVAPPSAALVVTSPTPTPATTPPSSGGLSVAGHVVPWPYIGLGVVTVGLGAYLLLRRRTP